jgi:hypothetical protein
MASGYTARAGRSGLTGAGAANSFLKRKAAPNASPMGKLVGKAKPGKPSRGLKNPNPAKPAARLSAPAPQAAQPDAQYNDAVDLIGRKEESRLGQLEGQETAVKHDFGIDDPTNPASRAEGLKRSFLARQKAASTGLAAEGQLYTGTHERALARTRRDEEFARSELRSAYEGAINGIGAEKAGVRFNTEEERAQAFEDWLARVPDADAVLSDDDEAAAGAEADASLDAEGNALAGPPKGNPQGSTGAIPGPPKGMASVTPAAPAPTGQTPAEKRRAEQRAAAKATKFKAAVEAKKQKTSAERKTKAQEFVKRAEGGPSKGVARPAVRSKAKPKARPKKGR